MAFCIKCGAQIEDNTAVCPNCGAQQAANNANVNNNFNAGFVPPPAAGNVMGDDLSYQFDPYDVQQNKVLALLAYLGILFLIPMLAAPNSGFARFHANQGIVLFLADIISSVAVGILAVILIWIPIVGVIFISLIGGAVSIASVVFKILGIVNAATGKAKELPLIGKIRILK